MTRYILYIEANYEYKNINDFCRTINVNIKEADVDLFYYLNHSFYYIIFDEKYLVKNINLKKDLSEFIKLLTDDIINHSEIHNMIDNVDIQKYILTKIKQIS